MSWFYLYIIIFLHCGNHFMLRISSLTTSLSLVKPSAHFLSFLVLIFTSSRVCALILHTPPVMNMTISVWENDCSVVRQNKDLSVQSLHRKARRGFLTWEVFWRRSDGNTQHTQRLVSSWIRSSEWVRVCRVEGLGFSSDPEFTGNSSLCSVFMAVIYAL